ncbi:MAG TPA: NIPSNAP family protein, partial [Humisphaera sp.]
MTSPDLTRRTVLTAALAAGAGAVLPATLSAAPANPAANPMQPEYYELRAYHLRRGPMGKRLDEYLKEAFIPAARRAGCGPVGAFNVTIGIGAPTTYVLVPHPTLDSFGTLADKLAADAEYAKAAATFLALPATDLPYVGLEVRLMRAFPHFPKVEAPKPEPRIFELRTYRSHAEPAGAKKVEMFDTAGEIAIFRRAGLTPVFFARDMTGPALPSLTYLLTYPDMAARD